MLPRRWSRPARRCGSRPRRGCPRRAAGRRKCPGRCARRASVDETVAGSMAPGRRTWSSSTSASSARAYSSATGILTSPAGVRSRATRIVRVRGGPSSDITCALACELPMLTLPEALDHLAEVYGEPATARGPAAVRARAARKRGVSGRRCNSCSGFRDSARRGGPRARGAPVRIGRGADVRHRPRHPGRAPGRQAARDRPHRPRRVWRATSRRVRRRAACRGHAGR